MLTKQTFRMMATLLIALPVAFSACVKDTCTKQQKYAVFMPIYKSKSETRDNIRSSAAQKIENPGKLCIRGQYIFLNEINKGIHVIDNSNPASPRNTAFIEIPGNLDIAVQGNALYADMYTDIVTLDISNPSNVSVKKITDGIFPQRYYGNGFVDLNNGMMIVGWTQKDTIVTVGCDEQNWLVFEDRVLANASGSNAAYSSAPPTGTGTGGSMARFTIMNERLYVVSESNLDVFNIASPLDPQQGAQLTVGWGIETIYPFKDKLFIGSTTGMFVYDVSNPDQPSKTSQFEHVRSCDPVIADDQYAFVTLRSGSTCQGFNNQLDILDVSNINAPSLVKVYQLTNPHGLSKDEDLLFICDGNAGLKIYNSSNVQDLQLLKEINGIDAYDVITMNKVALVVAKDGLYQYDYTDINAVRLLSKITKE